MGDLPKMEKIFLSIEKKGRGGRIVTIAQGFTRDATYIENLVHYIKHSCGTGGTQKGRAIEIQGDFRGPIRKILKNEGFQVKG